MVMVRKVLWGMLVSGGVFFWSLALVYGVFWLHAVYVARFNVPLVNGYTLQSNSVSSKAVIYDGGRKMVLAGVDDFAVSKGFVFGYTAVSSGCFLLDTKTGVLMYPVTDEELYRLIQEYSLRVDFTNVLTLRNTGQRPNWGNEAQTSGMRHRSRISVPA
jgi:hypothetical protein